jgi:hypothetical protein
MIEGYWLDLCGLSQRPEAGFGLSNKHYIFRLTSKEVFFSSQLAEDLFRGFSLSWKEFIGIMKDNCDVISKALHIK